MAKKAKWELSLLSTRNPSPNSISTTSMFNVSFLSSWDFNSLLKLPYRRSHLLCLSAPCCHSKKQDCTWFTSKVSFTKAYRSLRRQSLSQYHLFSCYISCSNFLLLYKQVQDGCSHTRPSFFINVLCVLFSFFHLLPKINGKYLLSEIKNWIKINSFQYDEVGWIKNIHRLILVHFEHKHTISFSLLAFSSLYRSRLVGRSPRRWTGQ